MLNTVLMFAGHLVGAVVVLIIFAGTFRRSR